jgi:Tfp pilus assembly protein PilF
MMISSRSAGAALVCAASALCGAVASAQGTPAAAAPACDPGASQAVAKASLFLQRAAQEVQAKQDASKDLKQAITALTTPSKDNDAVGRAYYLGQAYILYLQQPGVAAIGPRSSYGIATDPSGTIDLFAAADTAFNTVEAAKPGCRAELAQWREQKPWLDELNASINALNAQKYDSAQAYATRALLLDRRAPYAYTVLASVATNKKDYTTAASMLEKAVTAASADTIYNDAKQNAMFDLANTYTMEYQAATGAAKAQAAQQAVTAWENVLAAGGRDARVAHALAVAGQILVEQKDTTALPKVYAPVLAAPATFGDQTLLNAGVVATQAHHPQDAARFFDAVLAHNPYQRDALKNLAASYVATSEPQKMLPLLDRLVALDPNNADNWLLYAYAYSGMLKDAKGNAKLTKAYTDSLVKYNTKSEKLTPVITVQEFSFGGDDKTATLGGTVENRGTTTKSFSFQVEFLDKSGNVVGTQTVNVGPIAPKASAPFKATVQSDAAVAYRYKPVT